MNKNYLYVGVGILVVVVLIGGYALRHRIRRLISPAPAPVVETMPAPTAPVPSAQTTPSGQTNQAVEVDLTDSGFSPATVTVKVGQGVNFVNKSSASMWVASNPHPTHTDLPGFDELSSGNTYSYTFTKVGTWGYHDHLSPSTKGTVVVTP